MKAVASITTRVMDGLCQLPGVAILDWCDRAAATLTRLHAQTVATVAVGQADSRCVFQRVEAAGAAWSGNASSEQRSMGPGLDQAPVNLQSVRDSFRDGQWVGWDFKAATDGPGYFDTQRLVPATTRRSAPPLNQRYELMNPSEILVGAVALRNSEGTPGTRVLIAEVALTGISQAELARVQAVFSVVLPILATRYVNAIGARVPDKRDWLTVREELILWKLVAGKKVPIIAGELHRSIYTVHDHVKSLHRKLGASNRGQLVSRALGHLGPLVAQASEATEAPPAAGEARARE
jgi:DNA-binding CsgD family transcriptional regulator